MATWSDAEANSVKVAHKSSKTTLTGFNSLEFTSTLHVHYGKVDKIGIRETAYVGMTEWLTCTPGLFEPWLRCRSICNAVVEAGLKDSVVDVHLFMDTNLTEAEMLALIPAAVKKLNKKEASSGRGVMYIISAGRYCIARPFKIYEMSVAVPTNYKLLVGAMRKKFGDHRIKFYVSGNSVEERDCDQHIISRFQHYSEVNERHVEQKLEVVKKEVSAIVPDITEEQLCDLILYIEEKLKIEK